MRSPAGLPVQEFWLTTRCDVDHSRDVIWRRACNASMGLRKDHRIRLVIQEIQEPDSPNPQFRVIAYPRRPCVREEPAVLSSRDELLKKLREVIPGLDDRTLAAADSSTRIVFARELELTDEQLAQLGLTR
jgi:hypothetical protein